MSFVNYRIHAPLDISTVASCLLIQASIGFGRIVTGLLLVRRYSIKSKRDRWSQEVVSYLTWCQSNCAGEVAHIERAFVAAMYSTRHLGRRLLNHQARQTT